MKRIASMLLAALLAASLCACGGTTTESESSSAASSAAPSASQASEASEPAAEGGASGEISMFYWGEEQTAVMEKCVELFNQQNPNVTIALNLIPGNQQYYTQMQTALPSGTGPDVMWNNADIANYLDYLYPLDEYIADSEIDLTKYPQTIIDFYTFDGQLYGIPKDYDTVAIFYNKGIFDEMGVPYPEAGWTWDDFLATATALTNESHYGFACDVTDAQVGYGSFVRQARGSAIYSSREAVNVNDAAMVEGLQFLMDMMYTHKVAATTNEVTEINSSDMLMSEMAAMISHGSWKVGPFYEVLGDQLGVVELPTGAHQGCQLNGLCYSITKDTGNFDAAWEFVQFLASKEGQEATCEAVIPAYEGAAENWLNAYPTLDLQVFLDATEYGYTEEAVGRNSRQVKEVLTSAIATITIDPSADIQGILDQAQAEMESLLQ